jgi:hypothetical protein
MKKALIIIGAVFAGLILLVLVGAAVGEDPQQPVVVIQSAAPVAEPTVAEPTPVPTPEPVTTLTSDEQRVYEFISSEFPDLLERTTKLIAMLESDASYAAIVKRLSHDGDEFVTLTKRWNNIDWGYGEVSDLEDDFNAYMNASRAFYRNWANGIVGGANIDQCATNAVKAEIKMDKVAPRVQAHLADLEGGSY